MSLTNRHTPDTHYAEATCINAVPSVNQANTPTISNDDIHLRIAGLDLDPIKVKLLDAEGLGWTLDQVDAIETEYRQFLTLVADHSAIVPTKLIDEFWHTHILDTLKYADDCQRIFGRFVHHFPYLGMRGDADRRNLDRLFNRTLDLVEKTFGREARWDVAERKAFDGTTAAGFCSTDCGEGNCTPVPSCESLDLAIGDVHGVNFHQRPELGN